MGEIFCKYKMTHLKFISFISHPYHLEFSSPNHGFLEYDLGHIKTHHFKRKTMFFPIGGLKGKTERFFEMQLIAWKVTKF